MKSKNLRHLQFAAATLFACSSPLTSHAATLQWDADPATPAAQDGSGPWNTTATHWLNGTNTAWTDANDATFGAGSDGLYKITLESNPTANSLAFAQSGYQFESAEPRTLTVSAATSTIVLASGKTATLGNNVTLTTATLNRSYILSGTGRLVIENGATLKSSGTANTNILSINQATVEVRTGGSLTTTPMAQNGTAIFINGLLEVNGGSVSIVGTAGIGQSTGTTQGTLTLNSGTVTASSTNGIRFGGTSGTTQGGTIQLNGGRLAAFKIFKGSSGVANSILNLNGGTLAKSVNTNEVFLTGLNRANVRNGGAIIDSNGFTTTIPQALDHSNLPGDNPTDGGLTKIGNGLLNLDGVNTYNGGTTIQAGNLQFGIGSVPTEGSITIQNAGALNLGGEFTTPATALASGKINPESTGAIALTADQWDDVNLAAFPNLMLGAAGTAYLYGALIPAGDTYRLGGGGGNLVLNTEQTLTGQRNLTIGATGATGTVSIASHQNHTGTTTVNGGTLQIGDGFTDGSIDPSSPIVNNATLAYNLTGTATPANLISGPGTLIKRGPGTLIIDHANAYSGPTTASAGYLVAAHPEAFGTSAVTFTTSTAQLQLTNNITLTNPVRCSDAGINRDGALKNLSGTNTLTDFGFSATHGTRIHVTTDSRLNLPNAFAPGNLSSFRIIGNGTLFIGGDTTGAIGTPHLFILGDDTLPGPTVIAGHDLALGAGSLRFAPASAATLHASDSSPRTFSNSIQFADTTASLGSESTGNLSFNGEITIANNLDLAIRNQTTTFSGIINETGGTPRSLTKSGNGTLAIGNCNLSGNITISQGTLAANGNLPNAASLTVNPDASLSPGHPTGSLTTPANTTILGTLAIAINGSTNASLHTSGNLDISQAKLTLTPINATQPVYQIASFGSLTGSAFAKVNGIPDGYALDYNLTDKTITLRTSATPGFTSWIASFNVSNPAPNADPDNDGLANAIEYAIGSNPADPTRQGTPNWTVTSSTATLEFHRADASETPDLTLTAEAGTDLTTWPLALTIGKETASSSPGVEVLENDSNPDTIRITLPTGTDRAKFIRLKATIAP